ncbi:MAG: hypothetical protein WBA93_30880 [Microcoleaceae cyanobacterium]
MIEEKFRDISIRGRIAYMLLCLEALLKKNNDTRQGWDYLLEKFWMYTNIEFLDDWQDIAAELLPDSIEEVSDFESGEFEYLDKENFYSIKLLYSKINEEHSELIETIYFMGTLELFGALVNNGEQSLKYLKKAHTLFKKNQIKFPAISSVSRFNFYKNNGWGEPFRREDIII